MSSKKVSALIVTLQENIKQDLNSEQRCQVLRGPQRMGMIVLGQEKEETRIVREFCGPWYKSTNIQQIFIQFIIY